MRTNLAAALVKVSFQLSEKDTLLPQRGPTFDCDDRFLCNGGVICLFPDSSAVDPRLLLAILNSGVFWTLIRHWAPTMGREQHVYRAAVMKNIPIPIHQSSNPVLQQISSLAGRLMDEPLRSQTRRNLQSEIDKLVATLYGAM